MTQGMISNNIGALIRNAIQATGGRYVTPPVINKPTPYITPTTEQELIKWVNNAFMSRGHIYSTPQAPKAPPAFINRPVANEGTVLATYAGQGATGYEEAEGKFSSLTDKQLRFEIDDKNSKIVGFKDDPYSPYAHKSAKLSDFLKHEELFKQYPGLAGISVYQGGELAERRGIGPEGAAVISEDGVPSKIILGDAVGTDDKAKGLILHEIQHLIQDVEGFASGGSKKGMATGGREEFINIYEKMYSESLAEYQKYNANAKKLPQWLDRSIQDEALLRSYKNLAGEVEARDTASRGNLTKEQRVGTQPLAGENIKLTDMIVRNNRYRS